MGAGSTLFGELPLIFGANQRIGVGAEHQRRNFDRLRDLLAQQAAAQLQGASGTANGHWGGAVQRFPLPMGTAVLRPIGAVTGDGGVGLANLILTGQQEFCLAAPEQLTDGSADQKGPYRKIVHSGHQQR